MRVYWIDPSELVIFPITGQNLTDARYALRKSNSVVGKSDALARSREISVGMELYSYPESVACLN